MSALKEQLESLSAQRVEGIVLSHPAEKSLETSTHQMAEIVDLDAERSSRRGRYFLTAVAAAIVLLGGFLVFTNGGDDNSAPSPVATEGELDGPIVGPNGEDLGIWSDAILGLGPQGFADRARQIEQSIVRSLPEINACLEAMDKEPFEIEWLFADGDGTGIVPAPIAGERAFAETKGFGTTAVYESLSAYPADVDTCYYGTTVEGLNGPDAWATEEFVAATSLVRLVGLVVPVDPEVSLAGAIEVLISEDPSIVGNENTWSSCMDDRGFEYDSELRARADLLLRLGELDEANRSVFNGTELIDTPEFAAFKADEVAVAVASWDCSGGEAGEILRENARQRALANFVVTYRDELDVQFGTDLFTACQSAQTMVADESADIQERGEARLQDLGCEEPADLSGIPAPPD